MIKLITEYNEFCQMSRENGKLKNLAYRKKDVVDIRKVNKKYGYSNLGIVFRDVNRNARKIQTLNKRRNKHVMREVVFVSHVIGYVRGINHRFVIYLK